MDIPNFSFVKAYNVILADKNLTPTEKIVFSMITSLDNGMRHCNASYENLADRCGMSIRSVIRTIESLEKKMYVAVMRTPNSKIIISKFSLHYKHDVYGDDDSTMSDCHSAMSDCHSEGVTLSPNKNIYNNIYKNSSKVREDSNTSRIDNNTLIFSNMQSMVSPQTQLERLKKRVDLNSEVEVALAIRAVLTVYCADNDSETFRLPYILFTTFAREFKTFKGYKHKPISFDKFKKYFEKLEKFTPQKLNNETLKYEKICHTFCILEYDQDDIEDMVHDYFNQVFEDCDYSIHHFMSDSVLATRFWTIENRHAEMMAE